MKRALYVFLVLVIAGAGALGWYRYFSYKQQNEYHLAKSSFIEDFQRASEKYTPATVVSTEGNLLTYRIPRQVIRDGQIYVDSELQTALVTDTTQLYTFASTSLGMTVYTIPPSSPIRIQTAPISDGPASRQAVIIYVNQDAFYPQE